MYKKVFLGVILAGIASVVAHLYVQSQVYHPVVRLNMPDGLSITALLPETKERKTCGAANDQFLAPFKQQCKDCKIAAARCERDLEGLELAMQRGEPIPYPMVVSREMKIAVIGPVEKANLGCQIVAKDMVARGVNTAACVVPPLPPSKS